MLEAILFGHEGAFTGASTANKAFFAADGGTLLLDEISEMPWRSRPSFFAHFRKKLLLL